MEETQNTPGGAILRPMLRLAEQRKRDLERCAELEAERDAARAESVRKRHIESQRTPSAAPARPAPKRKRTESTDEAQNTPAGAILRPMLQKR
jgi:hypothetical protein